MYLFEVKKPCRVQGSVGLLQADRRRFPAKQAFRPMDQGDCPMVQEELNGGPPWLTVEHLRRRRRLFRQARPHRQGRRLPPPRRRNGRRLAARAGRRRRPSRSSCIPTIPRPCSPAPTTACGAAPTAAPPSGAPTSPTPRSRSGRSWSTAAIPKRMLRRRLADRRLSQRRRRRELAQAARRPTIGSALQGPVRLARDALRPEPEEAGRDLRRARDQRRDAQHRRRRDLDRLQRRPDQARRAAASQEQDRERHHGRGHARRPRRDHQPGRSRCRRSWRCAWACSAPPTMARPGRTWRSSRFSPTTYGRDIKVSPAEPNTLYAALSVAAVEP